MTHPSIAQFVFSIPLMPKSMADNWPLVSRNLDATLSSIINSDCHDWLAVVACHDYPDSALLDHPQVVSLQVPFEPVTDPAHGSRDKQRKRRYIAAWLKQQSVSDLYIYALDADDWIHRSLVGHVLKNDNKAGYLLAGGYKLDMQSGTMIQVNKRFYRSCGSSFIGYYIKEELPESYEDSRCIYSVVTSGAHRKHPDQARSIGKEVSEITFPAALYLMNHAESLYSKKREGKQRLFTYKHFLRNRVITEKSLIDIIQRDFGIRDYPNVISQMSGGDKGVEPNPADPTAEVRDTPWMPKTGVTYLSNLLSRTEIYLEYGAGGSTLLAARKGVVDIFSVESDNHFLSAVQDRIRQEGKARFHPVYVDIGPTRNLGYPTDRSCKGRWPEYPNRVWDILREQDISPELVLIDGRFRVACFLASLLNAREGTTILFDDYSKREHYWVVEKYCAPERMIGRMAEFRVPAAFDRLACSKDLQEYAVVAR